MKLSDKILVTGGAGFLGQHVVAQLKARGIRNIVIPRSREFNLTCEQDVSDLFELFKPDVVIHLAAVVGGIGANLENPGRFYYENLMMGAMTMEYARRHGTKKFVAIGTICFPADTQIKMADGTFKAIETISSGDIVVSAKGLAQKVKAISKRLFKGSLLTIKLKGSEPLIVTPEHPFLTARGWIKAEHLTRKDTLVHIPTTTTMPVITVSLLNQEDSSEYDQLWQHGLHKPRLLTAIPTAQVPLAGDIAWLLGVFVADGFSTPQSRRKRARGGRNYVEFTPGWNDELAQEIATRFERVWGLRPQIRKNKTSLLVTIGHRIACDFFSQCYRDGGKRGAHNKIVPECIIRATPQAKLDFLKGYWAGDGHIRDRSKDEGPSRNGQILAAASSVSQTLSLQIKDMLLTLNIWGGVYRRTRRAGTIEGRPVNQRTSWAVRITGKHAIRFVALLEKRQGNVDTTFQWNVPIRSITQNEETETEVFNLSIETDESYLVYGLAVHNCAYPCDTPAPFKETDLWLGFPESSNAPYGLAKKVMLVQAQAYRKQYGFNAIYLLPVNLMGPNDNFDPASSHVIPAMIRRFLEARDANTPSVTLWGTGNATREFIFVRDAAHAIVLATERYDGADPVNVGSGQEISICDLATLIKKLTAYPGEILWDVTKPDGQPRRLLDTTRAEAFFQFRATTSLEAGLRETIEWYEKRRHP